MKRSTLITTASALAVAAAPAAALAHNTKDHDGKQHRGVHHVRGTVASLTDDVLTVTKADGTTVTARVTKRTRIGCKPAPAARTARRGADDGPGDDRGKHTGADHKRDDHGKRKGDDRGKRGVNRHRRCTTADLTEGTIVRKGDWRGSGTSAVWTKLELRLKR
jgi:hypothetical protein